MNNEFSLSELYDVFIKATYPIEIGGRVFTPGETICAFDKIQLANFNEVKSRTSARGGFNNVDHVFWEQTKEVDLVFSQGIFNHLQFALMCNAKLIDVVEEEVEISKREVVESDENGVVTFSKTPSGAFFVYNKETGERIYFYTSISPTQINISIPFLEVVLDYVFIYEDGAQHLKLGRHLIGGALQLEGKTRVKDDISGKTRTGIIKIPKLKLMSDLSMRLGKNANPVVANLRAKAIPSGNRQSTTVMDLFFLNDDIDSDM